MKCGQVLFATLAIVGVTGDGVAQERISRPGEYRGYSAAYPSITDSSRYVDVGDARLAVSIFRPSRGGVPDDGEKLPTIIFHYRTAPREESVAAYVKAGYVVLWIRQRGSGPSFGPQKGFVTPQNGRDVERVIDWARRQPWSNGEFAMAGGSHGGAIQWVAAARKVPGLRAITPSVATARIYSVIYPNGVSMLNVPGQPGNSREERNLPPIEVRPVDEDEPPYPLLRAALESQADNLELPDEWLVNMHRDTFNPKVGYAPGMVVAAERREDLLTSGTKAYHMAGWYDLGVGVQIIDYMDFGEKLLIGPWTHQVDNTMQTVERLRWIDRWTKQVDNGVDREPPVYYYTLNAPEGLEWNFAASWPPASQVITRMYLTGERTGTVESVNDGGLTTALPRRGTDRYTVDLGAGHFENGMDPFDRNYGDLTDLVDRRALTYTSPRLEEDTEVTGFPVAHFWVTSTADDGNFIFWIEDVDADGKSNYVTHGAIRGSHRKIVSEPAYDALGIPYHPSLEADDIPLSSTEPVELEFEAIAISYVFKKGHRIRVSITGAAGDTYQQPEGFDVANPPTIGVYRGGDRASYVDFPVIPPGTKHFVGSATSPALGYDGDARLWVGREVAYIQLGEEWVRCDAGGTTWTCGEEIGDVELAADYHARAAAISGERLSFRSAQPFRNDGRPSSSGR